MSTLAKELSLSEKLVLLSLDDEKGKLKKPTYTQLGLKSTLMMQLVLDKKVKINEDNKLVFINNDDPYPDNEYLHKATALYYNEGNSGLWDKLGYVKEDTYDLKSKRSCLKQMTFESLVKKQICTEGKGVYPVQNLGKKVKDELKMEIKQAILNSDRNIDPSLAILCKLVKLCDLTNAIFSYKTDREIKEANTKIDEMEIDYNQLPMDVKHSIKSLLEATNKTFKNDKMVKKAVMLAAVAGANSGWISDIIK